MKKILAVALLFATCVTSAFAQTEEKDKEIKEEVKELICNSSATKDSPATPWKGYVKEKCYETNPDLSKLSDAVKNKVKEVERNAVKAAMEAKESKDSKDDKAPNSTAGQNKGNGATANTTPSNNGGGNPPKQCTTCESRANALQNWNRGQ